MKSLNLAVAVCLVALLAAATAFADETPSLEVTGASSLSFTHLGDKSVDTNTTNTLSFSATVSYFLISHFEAGLGGSYFESNTQGQGQSRWSASLVPTFNLFEDPANSPFLSATAGYTWTQFTGLGPTLRQFSYSVGIGKRFEVVSHVTWSPEVGVLGTSASSVTDPASGFTLNQPQTFGYFITPLQISILL